MQPVEAAELHIEPLTETRRDRYGRYLVNHPRTGKQTGATRATTIAKALDDTSNLMDWNARMVAIGLATRPDLLALVAAADNDDRKTLNQLCKRASEAGGATSRRDQGTASHSFLERHLANPDWLPPAPYDADVRAVMATVAAAGLHFAAGMSERIVMNSQNSELIVGTFDGILTNGTTQFICDYKTGSASSLKYAGVGWAIQLAIYANAECLYNQGPAKDGSDDTTEPMPEVDRTTGIIIHCEPGTGIANLHWIDLTIGAEALQLALQVRAARKAKPIEPFTTKQATVAIHQTPTISGADVDAGEDWRAATTARIRTIIDNGNAESIMWPEGVATIKSGLPISRSDAEQVDAMLALVEKEHGLPFPADDTPTPPPVKVKRRSAPTEDTELVDPEEVAALNKAAAAFLTPESLAWIKDVMAQALNANRPIGMTGPSGQPTMRRLIIAQTLIELAGHQDDDIAWAVVDAATNGKAGRHSLGDAYGSLRKAEAHRAFGIAKQINDGTIVCLWHDDGVTLSGDINPMPQGTNTNK